MEWIAFSRIEPFGPEHEDWRAAMIAATVANAHLPKGKKARIADFMPKRPRPKPDKNTLAQKIHAAFSFLGVKKNVAPS
jgi:hypothetical protein